MNQDRRAQSIDHVVVVGGSGAVGSLFVDLLRADGARVTVVDLPALDPDTAGDITAPDATLRNVIASATTVLLALPETVALAADLRDMSDDALLVETLSVKSRFSAHVETDRSGSAHSGSARSGSLRRTGGVVGINPMFAPSLGMDGRPVAAVVHSEGPGVDAFLDRISGWGGRVVRLDATRHDRLAAATQALTHAAVLSFGLALAELDLSIEDIDAIAPPPHTTALGLLARITGGEPEVYWDVQAGNPYASGARSALNRAAKRLSETVDSGSEAEFEQLLADAGSGLGPSAAHYRSVCADIFGIVRASGER